MAVPEMLVGNHFTLISRIDIGAGGAVTYYSHPMRQTGLGLSVALLLCSAIFGCTGQHPRLTNPGTIEQQRLRALIHDPYPDPDLGPKDQGMRPREFQQPLPEPVRNRIYVDSWLWRR